MKRVSIIMNFDQSTSNLAIQKVIKNLRMDAFELSRGGVEIAKATQEHLVTGDTKNLLEEL